ncbi:hypothetical protein BE15_42600 [Sorangium cellulosum]|uniref:Uncharacterized protein n=1 Tax=Sorangium cellulosum TaxID=56 RepID=A0A150QH52_SORCE|nr:hypothetical protein BE15_42600 [Sorangium cellulosum]
MTPEAAAISQTSPRRSDPGEEAPDDGAAKGGVPGDDVPGDDAPGEDAEEVCRGDMSKEGSAGIRRVPSRINRTDACGFS